MDWGTLKTQTAVYFSDKSLVRGFTADDILKLSPDYNKLYLGPIDWTWGQSDNDIDQPIHDARTNYLRRCNQVEILISEAAMLIERSLADCMKYDELNIERFKLLMEFTEFCRTYDQQLNEQADADYWRGLVVEEDLSSQARLKASGDRQTNDTGYDSMVSAYQQAIDILWNQGNDGDTARYPLVAEQQATKNAKVQYESQFDANKLDSDSRIARKKYETQSRAHQVERQQIARDMFALKISEFQRHGGAINYNERMREIGTRARNDFVEVFARLNGIVLGLREFYAVTDPSEEELKNDLEKSRTRIEGAVTWLRKAANALARAKMDEQETIVRLTIERDPQTLIQQLRGGLTVSFQPTLVAKMERVRLMGLSASAEYDDDTWLDLEVTSPAQKLKSTNITLPAVTTRLGRASSAKSLNVRDVAGARPIINRSPVGDWTVRALRDYRGDNAKRLDLDFRLAFVRA